VGVTANGTSTIKLERNLLKVSAAWQQDDKSGEQQRRRGRAEGRRWEGIGTGRVGMPSEIDDADFSGCLSKKKNNHGR